MKLSTHTHPTATVKRDEPRDKPPDLSAQTSNTSILLVKAATLASNFFNCMYVVESHEESDYVIEKISLKLAFNQPTLVSHRFGIDSSGSRGPANLAAIVQDWQRCFVLYCDYLRRLPEFALLDFEDQVI